MELAFDTSKIAIFDADTGVNLTIEPTGAQEPPAPSAAPAPSGEQTPTPPPTDQTPPLPAE